MKHVSMKIPTVMLIMLVVFASGLSASAQNEVKTITGIQSMDLEKSSLSDIKSAYEKSWKAYNEQCEDLQSSMQKAYEKNNAEKYYAARDQLRALDAPYLTSEQSETLVTRMMNAGSDEKKELAAWLYQNSNFYHPTLTMTMDSSSDNSRFSYRQSIGVAPGESVKLPTLESSSAKGVFVGWGITPDEVTYKAGDEISMPYSDQTLYAIFQQGVRFSDSVTGTDVFSSDASVAVPTLTAKDASAVFSGWYDANGKKLEGDHVDGSVSASYQAGWKNVGIDQIATRYYKDNTIPSGEQVALQFQITNNGNMPLSGAKITLESDASLKVLNGPFTTGMIMPNDSRYGAFTVLTNATSGSKLDATINVTDSDGNVWKTPFTITVK